MGQRYNSYKEYKKYFRILPIIIFAVFLSDAFFFSALLHMFQKQTTESFIYLIICALIFLPIFLKFIKTLKQILRGINRKYLLQSLYSFCLYLLIIIVTIVLNGKIRGEYLFLYTGLLTGEGIVMAVVRGHYFLKTMQIYYPFIVEKRYFTDVGEMELYEQKLSEELERIYNCTNSSEVLKALDLRQASSIVIPHVLIPFFTVESLLMLGLVL